MAENYRWAYQKGVLWALELSLMEGGEKAFSQIVTSRIEAVFEEIHEFDASTMATDIGLSNSETIIRRLSKNRRCFIAKVKGTIAAYGWVSTGAECVGEMGRQIRLRPNEAYVWDCLTLPAYRRQRLYSALLGFINITLANEGFRRIWIGSNLENQPSLRGFDNAGFRPAALITHFRLNTLNCLWVRQYGEAPTQLTTAAREAFSMESDWNIGPLVFGRVKPVDLFACRELEQ